MFFNSLPGYNLFNNSRLSKRSHPTMRFLFLWFVLETNMKSYRIATIPGDGIGKEVVPEGIRVLETAGQKHGFTLQWTQLPWSCEFYQKTGKMMPPNGLDQLKEHDAIFLGAVGFPPIPDHISLWGLLIPIRRHFRQYANLRPVRLMPGVESPL